MDQVTQYVIVTCSYCSVHFGMLWGWALFFKVVLFSELDSHLMTVHGLTFKSWCYRCLLSIPAFTYY